MCRGFNSLPDHTPALDPQPVHRRSPPRIPQNPGVARRSKTTVSFRLFFGSKRSGSSVWLERLPVTQEVASSSLVRTARHTPIHESGSGFFLGLLQIQGHQ